MKQNWAIKSPSEHIHTAQEILVTLPTAVQDGLGSLLKQLKETDK